MHLIAELARMGIVSGVLFAALGPAGEVSAQPRPEAREQRIDRLIEQLGDESYAVREQAQRGLAKLGFAAYEALEAATEDDDLEVASRARYLLRLIRVEWTQEGDPPEVAALLSDYEFQPGEERLDRIRRLGGLSGGQGTAALCRLVRFEGSELVSKYAAMEILDRRPPDRAGREQWAQTVRKGIPRAGRPAARWLLSYLQLKENPKAALAAWNKMVDAEQALLGRPTAETNSSIIVALLYHLAEAQAEQNEDALAEKTAAEARAMNPGNGAAALIAHWEIAVSLQRRGLFPWAEAEYRRVIDSGMPELQVRGRILLAEMKHDQQDHLGAAKTLEAMLQTDPRQLQVILAGVEQTAGGVRARMNYFYARHWRQQGDRRKEREYLDKAIEADPGEIDALIARYQLPDTTPEYRQETRELIARSVQKMQRQVEVDPEGPSNYNQLAWLMGNTAGDLDEALKLAHKAIEMSPDSGAYYDTLAHVCFARGEYQNAVKYQTRAAELEPHSGLINKQLKVFRAKLEKTEREAGGADRLKKTTPAPGQPPVSHPNEP